MMDNNQNLNNNQFNNNQAVPDSHNNNLEVIKNQNINNNQPNIENQNNPPIQNINNDNKVNEVNSNNNQNINLNANQFNENPYNFNLNQNNNTGNLLQLNDLLSGNGPSDQPQNSRNVVLRSTKNKNGPHGQNIENKNEEMMPKQEIVNANNDLIMNNNLPQNNENNVNIVVGAENNNINQPMVINNENKGEIKEEPKIELQKVEEPKKDDNNEPQNMIINQEAHNESNNIILHKVVPKDENINKDEPKKEEIKSENVEIKEQKIDNLDEEKEKQNKLKEEVPQKDNSIQDKIKNLENALPLQKGEIKIVEKKEEIKEVKKEDKKEEVPKKEEKKVEPPKGGIADKIKNLQNAQQPVKKEEKKISMADRIKMMSGGVNLKPINAPKADIPDKNKKVQNAQVPIKKEEKKVEPPKGGIADKIKNLQNAQQPAKKDEKKEEKGEKKMSMADRIKMMSGGANLKPNNGPNPVAAPRRMSAFEGGKLNFNPGNIANKTDEKKDNKAKPDDNKPSGSGNKFNQMKMMLEKRGGPRMGPRPSAIMGMPHFGNFGININNNNNNQDLNIIEEKSDKLKEGYNPADDLEKKLEKVVVQKNKKKIKKPTFEE